MIRHLAMRIPLLTALVIVLLAGSAPNAHSQPVKSYEVLSGEGYGSYTLVSDGDTLTAHVQHASPSHEPSRRAARDADVVVWCYPQHYSHPNHIFPNAEDRIYSVRVGDMITFYSNLDRLPDEKAELIKERSNL